MRTDDLDDVLADWLMVDALAPAPTSLVHVIAAITARRRPRPGWLADLRGHWVGRDGATTPGQTNDSRDLQRPHLTVIRLAAAWDEPRYRSPRAHRSGWTARPTRPTALALLLLAAATLILGLLAIVGGRLQSLQAPAEFLWSAQGGDDGMYFAGSNGGTVTVAPTGQVWVTDSSHDRFAIFDPSGIFVSYWGASGSGDGQFHLRSTVSDARSELAFAPDGSFYVLDAGNLRVQHFAADRTFLRSWGGHGTVAGLFREPIDIAVGAHGTVYVLDALRDVVESYDPDGTVIGSFRPGTAGSASSLALDAHDDLYVGVCCTTPNGVLQFDAAGSLLATFLSPVQSAQDHPASLAVDTAGILFVTHGPVVHGDKIEAFDPDGALLGTFGGPGRGDGQFGYGFPQIALDGRGAIYATDGALNRLEKFRLRAPLTP